MTRKYTEHAPQGDCPQPRKMPFSLKKQAKKAAKRRPGTGIYKCECGRFHLYTKKRATTPRDIIDGTEEPIL